MSLDRVVYASGLWLHGISKNFLFGDVAMGCGTACGGGVGRFANCPYRRNRARGPILRHPIQTRRGQIILERAGLKSARATLSGMGGVVSSRTIGYLSVIAAGILWASSGTASKALFLGGITPFELVQARVSIAALFMGLSLLLFAKKLLRVQLRDLGYFLVLGGVGLALVQATYLYTISKMQVAAAILIQYTSPILVAAYSICFWSERLTALKVVALFLSLFGCYLVVGGYNLELLKLNREGAITGTASAALFAMYSLLGNAECTGTSPGLWCFTP